MTPKPTTWLIERLVPGGEGFTRTADGRVAFAPGAFPGDRIQPTKLEEKKSFVRALEWKLVEPGPNRVSAPCAVADRCGGCDWMFLERKAQVAAKADLLRDALTRVGGLRDLPRDIPIVEAGPDLGYRRRLRLHIDASGRFGLFARGSHSLVEIEQCPVSADEINRTVTRLRETSRNHPGAFAAFSDVEVRAAPSVDRVSCRFFPRDLSLPSDDHRPRVELGDVAEAVLAELSEHVDVSVAKHSPGQPQNWPLSCGVTLSVPPGVFVQVNWHVNEALVDAVVQGAKKREVKTFCDLYAGAGNFTLPLLAGGLSGVGIERNSAAVDAAKRTARLAGLDQNAISGGDVARRVHALARARRRFDLVVIDPPRAGAATVAKQVRELKPSFIAMCSCDPPTLARDLARLGKAGYRLDEIIGFDMFPHTHHVEALAWLSAGDSPPASLTK